MAQHSQTAVDMAGVIALDVLAVCSQGKYLVQGTPYNALSEAVRTAISELADLKYQVLTQVGDAVGSVQTYRL